VSLRRAFLLPHPRPAALVAAGLAAALLVAACGSSDKSALTAVSVPASLTQTTATASAPTPPVPAAIATKPTVVAPKGPAPKTLVIKDLVKGSGPAAAAGQSLTVQYVGVLYKDGTQFDASWDRNMPFTFTLGQGAVINGWDQGLVGMHVDGRRELIIPAALAYGPTGQPPKIPPNSPLVFVIDLLKAG